MADQAADWACLPPAIQPDQDPRRFPGCRRHIPVPDMVFKDGAINGAYREAMVKPIHNRLQICNKKGSTPSHRDQ